MDLLPLVSHAVAGVLSFLMDREEIHLRQPEVLLLLFALPLFILWGIRALFSARVMARLIEISFRGVRDAVTTGFLVLALFSFIAARADPYEVRVMQKPVWKHDVVDFVFDLSSSQLAADVSPTRLDTVKSAALAVLEIFEREGINRVCLGFFTMQFNRLIECTTDLSLVREVVTRLHPSFAGGSGTNFSAALPNDYEVIRKERIPAGARITLFIFSDGGKEFWKDESGMLHEEEPDWSEAELEKGVAAFRTQGIRVIPVGVGGTKPVSVFKIDAEGRRSEVTNGNGKVVYTRVDERIIQKIARWAGNEQQFFLLRNVDEWKQWLITMQFERREVDHFITEKKEVDLWRYLMTAGVLFGTCAIVVPYVWGSGFFFLRRKPRA